MGDPKTSERPAITIDSIKTRELTEAQKDANKQKLLELIAHSNGIIDLTEWVRDQFMYARNNESLHADLIVDANFFGLFPLLQDENNLDKCILNSISGEGFATELAVIDPTTNQVVTESVLLSMDFEKLTTEANFHHEEANFRITQGRKIAEDIGVSGSFGTVLRVFRDALQIVKYG